MSTKKNLQELLQKHAEGRCTPEEEALLQEWFRLIGNDKTSAGLSSGDQQRMLKAFRNTSGFRPARVRWLTDWRVAAMVAGILSGGWMIARVMQSSGRQEAAVFLQLTTGNGEVKKVVLPDSSVVWMNAGTKLAYHPDFARHRELRLSGEALFDVTHDNGHPFTVITADSLQTRVLGTSFNIRAYDRAGETEVTVVSGRVQVAKDSVMGVLGRDQAIHYERSDRSYVQTNESAMEVTGWKEGKWMFRNMGAEELALLLQTQYGITLVNNLQAKDTLHMDANFTKQQTAREIVSTFCLLANCQYRWSSDIRVEIYKA